MSLPYFFVPDLSISSLTLDEDTSKHMIQVLRMQAGEALHLTDGKGTKARAVIVDDNRKRCTVRLEDVTIEKATEAGVAIGISLVKNASRFEWFLEKATEIGVTAILPLLCDRTEKEKFRYDRLNNILISAMLQSQQCWMPVLQEPVTFDKIVMEYKAHNKYIAHCLPEEKKQLITHHSTSNNQHSSLILVGPEGDFTEKEIDLAISNGYQPVALGNTRLRTETAGMVAATLLCQMREN